MFLEHTLTSAQDSNTILKFDGSLEPIIEPSTEIWKEDFVEILKEKDNKFGQRDGKHNQYQKNVSQQKG